MLLEGSDGCSRERIIGGVLSVTSRDIFHGCGCDELFSLNEKSHGGNSGG